MTTYDLPIADDEGPEVAPGIVARDLHFNISAHAKRHWFGGDPMQTAVVDAFSIFLPVGERFFIRALKHYANAAGDKELTAEIRGYAVQEAYHTREHEDYNSSLADLGYDLEKMEGRVKWALYDDKDPILNVAMTCAIEHLTATLSIAMLRDRDVLFRDAEPAYRRLWTWHALEELEHAAVALHVYEKATAHRPGWVNYLIRVMSMNFLLIPFFAILMLNIGTMAKADGIRRGPGLWWRFLRVTWGNPGYLRLGFGTFIRYYSPWFDPSKTVDPELVEKGRALLKADMGEIPA